MHIFGTPTVFDKFFIICKNAILFLILILMKNIPKGPNAGEGAPDDRVNQGGQAPDESSRTKRARVRNTKKST